MNTKRIQKLITFSPQLYQLAYHKAKMLGLSFADYIRHLTVADVKEEAENIPMVDEETEKRIGESLKALERGEYIDIDPRNEKELNKFLGIK